MNDDTFVIRIQIVTEIDKIFKKFLNLEQLTNFATKEKIFKNPIEVLYTNQISDLKIWSHNFKIQFKCINVNSNKLFEYLEKYRKTLLKDPTEHITHITISSNKVVSCVKVNH